MAARRVSWVERVETLNDVRDLADYANEATVLNYCISQQLYTSINSLYLPLFLPYQGYIPNVVIFVVN